MTAFFFKANAHGLVFYTHTPLTNSSKNNHRPDPDFIIGLITQNLHSHNTIHASVTSLNEHIPFSAAKRINSPFMGLKTQSIRRNYSWSSWENVDVWSGHKLAAKCSHDWI